MRTTDLSERIMYQLPDLTDDQIEEVKEAFQAEYETIDVDGRHPTLIDLAERHGVSLRSVAYAVIPGLKDDVDRHTRIFKTARELGATGAFCLYQKRLIKDTELLVRETGEYVHSLSACGTMVGLSKHRIRTLGNQGVISLVRSSITGFLYLTESELEKLKGYARRRSEKLLHNSGSGGTDRNN